MKEVLEHYNPELVKRCKTDFISGKSIKTGKISDSIAQSWLQSRQLGANASQTKVPEEACAKDTLSRISISSKYFRNREENLYQQKFQLLSKMGIATFYLNSNLSVYAKGGNRDLLDELKQKNIKFSTCFSERYVGTNAAAIAMRSGKPCYVIGEEHYLDALTGYVTYAKPYFRSYSQEENLFMENEFINLYIIPLEKITEVNLMMVEYMGMTDFFLGTSYESKELIMDYDSQTKHACYVIMDMNEVIIDVNKLFCSTFQISNDYACGNRMDTLFPELKPIMKRLKNREKIISHSIIFSSLPAGKNEFYLDGMAFERKEYSYSGYVVTLTKSKYVQKYINRIVNRGAYYSFDSLIGKNELFIQTKKTAQSIAKTSSNVLICGESGTGKELFAQAIHNASKRREEPFISINCGALPRELISSELFGYEEGAFTGAKRGGSMGKFEQAHNGTLFLDEIGEMPLDMQSVLLRVIEEKQITRLGGSQSRPVNVRIIAATNRNLLDYANAGKFRADLYYRLNVLRLDLPALRNRSEDIILTAQHFLESFDESMDKHILGFTEEALACMSKYHWPGNVRELRNVVERCVNLESSDYITYQTLPAELHGERNPSGHTTGQTLMPADKKSLAAGEKAGMDASYQCYEDYEAQLIKSYMKECKGNKTLVADKMGITRATLYRKMKKITDWN